MRARKGTVCAILAVALAAGGCALVSDDAGGVCISGCDGAGRNGGNHLFRGNASGGEGCAFFTAAG